VCVNSIEMLSSSQPKPTHETASEVALCGCICFVCVLVCLHDCKYSLSHTHTHTHTHTWCRWKGKRILPL